MCHTQRKWMHPLYLLPAVIGFGLIGCSDTMPTGPDAVQHASPSNFAAKTGVAPAGENAEHVYLVTIENLTSTQPFSPGVLVTHTKKTHVFQPGTRSSEGIRLIAEEGDPATALADLSNNPDVLDVVNTAVGEGETEPGPILPGESKSFEIGAKANANRLSAAVMLICTNDGFTGLNAAKLPEGFKEDVYFADGYDAGTEQNTQVSEDIVDVPLCGLSTTDGNARTATDAPIMHHTGIQDGVGDLTSAEHGWDDPVARIVVRRVHQKSE